MKHDLSAIRITAQPDADPSLCHFVASQSIAPGASIRCPNREQAAGSPLMEPLFALPGVVQVWVLGDRLTIQKEGGDPWPETGKRVGEIVRRFLGSGQVLQVETAPSPAPSPEVDERHLKQVLQAQVNPALASHGGRVELVKVEGTEVFVRFEGGCQGCGSAKMTLQQGIEKTLKMALPQITAVRDVTDHASGKNPFFASSQPGETPFS